jgi:hypothetical protein
VRYYFYSLWLWVCCERSALKARTSRKLGVKEFQMATTHYLDLPSLERWLMEWRDALLSEAGETSAVQRLEWKGGFDGLCLGRKARGVS